MAKIPFLRAINRKLKFFDVDWDEKIFIHDLTTPFPWANETVDVVYCSHTLEHFTKEEGRRFLTECHRVLKKGGIIRLLLPDLRHLVTEYIEGRIRADDFVESLGVLYERRGSYIKDRLAPFFQFPHKCMYDTPRLLEILREIGFDATNKAPFESEISDIQTIELKGRTENAVIVEGKKR